MDLWVKAILLKESLIVKKPDSAVVAVAVAVVVGDVYVLEQTHRARH